MLIFNKEAWDEIYFSLSKNKLRTILTMIGVAWGMFLYIFLLGTAKGMENGFNKIFDGFATNSIFLWPYRTGEPYKGFPRGRELSLYLEDTQFLKEKMPEIDFIIPRNVSTSTKQPTTILRKNISKNYTVYGDFPIVNKVERKKLLKGRFLNDDDITQQRKVVVIGKENENQLFEKNENPLGQYIKINDINFKIIGVYDVSPNPRIRGNEIYIPFSTFQTLYNQGGKIGWSVISIKPQYDTKQAEEKIKKILRNKYNVAPDDELAFGAFNFGESYKKLTKFLSGMQILTWVVGSLTILAGVIAISNILLITVKERTLEIGIRRALGAKPKEIKEQILMESIVITVFSGMIGFILATFLLMIINSAIPEDSSFPFYNPTVNIWNILAALSIMVGLGLLIGLIPAQKAMKIKPIEALRTE